MNHAPIAVAAAVFVDKLHHVEVAAARGASNRLRPIISTSLTTIIGLIPLAISNSMWRPLCYAIIFGLLGSTVMAPVAVPCLHFLFTRKHTDAEAPR